MADSEIYRLNYTYSYGFYRLHIVHDGTGKIAGAKFANRPKVAATRAWLAAKGFEAQGDMLRLSDGSFVNMLRKVA